MDNNFYTIIKKMLEDGDSLPEVQSKFENAVAGVTEENKKYEEKRKDAQEVCHAFNSFCKKWYGTKGDVITPDNFEVIMSTRVNKDGTTTSKMKVVDPDKQFIDKSFNDFFNFFGL